jgi:hypothetical protein
MAITVGYRILLPLAAGAHFETENRSESRGSEQATTTPRMRTNEGGPGPWLSSAR